MVDTNQVELFTLLLTDVTPFPVASHGTSCGVLFIYSLVAHDAVGTVQLVQGQQVLSTVYTQNH